MSQFMPMIVVSAFICCSIGAFLGSLVPLRGAPRGEPNAGRGCLLWLLAIGMGMGVGTVGFLLPVRYFTHGLTGQNALAGPGIAIYCGIGAIGLGMLAAAWAMIVLRGLHYNGPDTPAEKPRIPLVQSPDVSRGDDAQPPALDTWGPALPRFGLAALMLLIAVVNLQARQPFPFPFLALGGFFVVHGYGIYQRRRWARWVAQLLAWSVMVAWLVGTAVGLYVFFFFLLGEGIWAAVGGIVLGVTVLASLLVVAVEVSIARATNRWGTDRLPAMSNAGRWLRGFAVAGALLGLLAGEGVFIFRNEFRSRQRDAQQARESKERQAARMRPAEELVARWCGASESNNDAARIRVEKEMKLFLREDSGALVRTMRFGLKRADYQERVGLLRLLAEPEFAVRSAPDCEQDHRQVVEQVRQIYRDPEEPRVIHVLARVVLQNQAPHLVLDAEESTLDER